MLASQHDYCRVRVISRAANMVYMYGTRAECERVAAQINNQGLVWKGQPISLDDRILIERVIEEAPVMQNPPPPRPLAKHDTGGRPWPKETRMFERLAAIPDDGTLRNRLRRWAVGQDQALLAVGALAMIVAIALMLIGLRTIWSNAERPSMIHTSAPFKT